MDTALLASMGIWVGVQTGFRSGAVRELLSASALPVLVYTAWALGIFASAATVVSIFLYGFRERWFWRVLVVGCSAWLVFPPIHSLIGLLGLVLLWKNQKAFPVHQSPEELGP